MKTIKIIFLFIAIVAMNSFDTFAQNYWGYTCKKFDVQVKTEDNDAKVIQFDFAKPIKSGEFFDWKRCEIIDSKDLSQSGGEGWLYTIKDAKGVEYTIKYVKDSETLEVVRTKGKKKWNCMKTAG